jgi:hypothetical protein
VSRLALIVVEAVLVLGLGRLLFHVSLPPPVAGWATFALVAPLGHLHRLASLAGDFPLAPMLDGMRQALIFGHGPGDLARGVEAAGLAGPRPARRLTDVPPGVRRLRRVTSVTPAA